MDTPCKARIVSNGRFYSHSSVAMPQRQPLCTATSQAGPLDSGRTDWLLSSLQGITLLDTTAVVGCSSVRYIDMNQFPRWLAVVFALTMLVLLAGGGWFYRAQDRQLRQEAERTLIAIAQSKVDQIAQWRAERLDDAAVIMESPFSNEAVARWLAAPQADTTEGILARFRSSRDREHYGDVLLVDAGGQVRLSLGDHRGRLHEDTMRALAEAFRQRRPMLSDLHDGPGDQPPHIDAIASLFARNGDASVPIGAVILRCDAGQFLYPLIQSWPTPSRTAETLLVRRHGDAVLFLNDLRHQKNTALKLRIPLSQTEVPAVMAVLGKEGVVEGEDYRGVEVVSVLKAIPDSPWFMVAKVDKTEAFAAWRFRTALIFALILSLLAAATTAVGFVWQASQRAHYRELFEAEAARRRSEERYRATLMSVGDGVITTGADGRVEMLNHVAETLTGWRESEARGRPLDEVFHIINEDTRQTVEDPVDRVLREGIVVGLANHSLLIARDGSERPIADSGAPIRGEHGRITGVVLVFRDQTQERAAQNRLRKETQRAQQYLDVAGVMIVALDADANVVSVNRKACEILGCAEKDVLAKNWFEHFIPDRVRDRVRSVFARIMAGQLELDEYVENDVVTRGGEERLIAWHNAIVRDDSGAIIGTLSSGDDITENRRAAEALKESEEKFKFLAERMADVVWTADLDFHTTYVSPSVEKVLGFTPEERKKQSLEEIISPESLERAQRLFIEELQREEESVADADRSVAIELEYYRKDGSTVWMENRMKAIRDARGAMVGIYGVSRDVTERKRAQEALRESEEQYRTLFENAQVGVYRTTPDGRILAANRALIQMLGYSSFDELAARNLERDGYDPDYPRCAFKEEIEREGEIRGRISVWTKRDGSSIFVSENARVVRGPDRTVLYYEGTTEDITERRRAEEERKKLQAQLLHAQKMEAVGRLAGGVAHDFNNMLQAILGNTELALEGAGPHSPLRESLDQIQQAARRSADLTRQLLAFARKQIVSPRTLDLNDTVSGTLKLLRRLIGEDIELAWMPGLDLWSVKIDPSQIDQVLANLAVNARDAIGGVGRMTIETANVVFDEAYARSRVDCAAGQYVMLAVTDSGRGMDKDTLGRLFEPFFTTKEVGKGTGLGLATVYGIVKQNGGLINVYSEPGQGTTFKIYLPRYEAEPVLEQAPSLARVPLGGSETILIVEDEAAILNIARRTLERLGYTVLAASKPVEAIRLAGEYPGPIHLLVTDVVMPEMNGRELAESLSPVKPDMKCLFMSGYTADIVAGHGIVEEGVLFIQKPFTVTSLAEKVREALDR
ncbi:MAG: PAS domain S-box protein [Acidobacteriota bacterium]